MKSLALTCPKFRPSKSSERPLLLPLLLLGRRSSPLSLPLPLAAEEVEAR